MKGLLRAIEPSKELSPKQKILIRKFETRSHNSVDLTFHIDKYFTNGLVDYFEIETKYTANKKAVIFEGDSFPIRNFYPYIEVDIRVQPYVGNFNYFVLTDVFNYNHVITKDNVYNRDGYYFLETKGVVLDWINIPYTLSIPVLSKFIHVPEHLVSKRGSVMSNKVNEATAAEPVAKFDTGAQRSKDTESVAFDLMHPIAERRIAKVWALGAGRYGRHNWELGFPPHECVNHLRDHLNKWLMGDDSEDHLAHMGCNLEMLLVYSETRPESFGTTRWANGQLTVEMQKEIADFHAAKRKMAEEIAMRKAEGDIIKNAQSTMMREGTVRSKLEAEIDPKADSSEVKLINLLRAEVIRLKDELHTIRLGVKGD